MPRNKLINNLNEAISIKYNNIVYEMQKQSIDVTVLSLGEAYFNLPSCNLANLPHPELFHYSHSRGIYSLREKLCNYYYSEYQVKVNPQTQIICTAGSKIGIYYALQILVEPGDEVLILEPFWVSYSEQVKLVGGIPRFIPMNISINKISEFITDKTRCIIFNNPQNPTGRNYTRSEVESIYEAIKNKNTWIISDEAYSDFVKDEAFISCGVFDPLFDRTIIVNSISKNFGISGWRIGYLISNSETVYAALKLNQHMITCAPTPLLMYIDSNFDQIILHTKPQINDLLMKRERLRTRLYHLSLRVIEGHATFYFFLDISDTGLTSEQFTERLLQEFHIAVVPGIGYGSSCDKYIRISFGSESEARVEKALEDIKLFMSMCSE